MNKNIRSFLRFGAFLLILVLVVLLANAVLIQTDTYSALPLAELKSRDDIDLAVVGSSIVGEHLNANLVSEQTRLNRLFGFRAQPVSSGRNRADPRNYRKNSPAYTVLSLEPYNLNSAKEYTSAYYRLTPYLSSWRDKITYYLDACREDGLYLDRLFMFREFGVESLSDILKTVGLRLNPLKTYEKLKPTLDDTVTYEGSAFCAMTANRTWRISCAKSFSARKCRTAMSTSCWNRLRRCCCATRRSAKKRAVS